MSHRKYGLRNFGPCLLTALGLIVFTAAMAQAEAGGEWDIEEKALSALPKGEEFITNELDQNFTYLFAIPTLSTEIHCQKMLLDEATIKAGGGSHGTLLLSECSTLPETCKVLEPIVAKVKSLLILHEVNKVKHTYILFSPLTAGGAFTNFQLEGKLCPLPVHPQSIEITGSVVAACLAGAAPAGLCSEERVKHLIETNSTIDALFAGQTEGGVALPKDGLFFGANKVTFTSRTILLLAAVDRDKKWRGLAP